MVHRTETEAENIQRAEGKIPCHLRTLGLMGAPGWAAHCNTTPEFCERGDMLNAACTCCDQCCTCGG